MSLLQVLKLPLSPTPGTQPATAKAAASGKAAGAAPKNEKLLQAAEAWRQTHGQANERIGALKAAVKAHCADGPRRFCRRSRKGW